MTVRLPLALLVAVTVGVAIAVPTALLDDTARGRAHDAQREQVAYAGLDLVAIARTVNGKLDISRFASVAYRPGQPASLFIDAKGRVLDTDISQPRWFPQAALQRAKTNDNAPVRMRDRLVVVEPIAAAKAPDKLIAAAVAYVDARPLDRKVAADSRTRWATAIGSWLLLSILLTLALLRLLGRPLSQAAGERTFFADAAHELKTPWAIVRAHADRARSQLPAEHEAPRTELAAITQAAGSAAHTVDNMLLLARLDQGVMGDAVRLRLDALVDTCVSEVRERHGEDLDIDFAALSPVAVNGNAALLQHALSNLLENAVRYGDTPIRVELSRVAGKARVTVTDSGAGVPPSQRELIFARFHRASTRGGGSGLGLAITAAVAKAHRGKVSYAERPDAHGAVFTLEIPAA